METRHEYPNRLFETHVTTRVRPHHQLGTGLGNPVYLISRNMQEVPVPDAGVVSLAANKPFSLRGPALFGIHTHDRHYLIVDWYFFPLKEEAEHTLLLRMQEPDGTTNWLGKVNCAAMWERRRGLSLLSCYINKNVMKKLDQPAILLPRTYRSTLRHALGHLQLWTHL